MAHLKFHLYFTVRLRVEHFIPKFLLTVRTVHRRGILPKRIPTAFRSSGSAGVSHPTNYSHRISDPKPWVLHTVIFFHEQNRKIYLFSRRKIKTRISTRKIQHRN